MTLRFRQIWSETVVVSAESLLVISPVFVVSKKLQETGKGALQGMPEQCSRALGSSSRVVFAGETATQPGAPWWLTPPPAA